ncbi:MAG: DUF1674 domain-containing protein [Gammaproteobacteria bacterium]|nr:DUF1674 domain-containing protein [Gammaproteobacteria bacterium]
MSAVATPAPDQGTVVGQGGRGQESLGPPAAANPGSGAPARKRELGGPTGPEPTRFGDWEKRGRCIDF